MKLLTASFAALVLLSGCSRYDEAQHITSSASAPPRSTSAASANYVQLAASAELFEVQAGQLALQRASNPQIRSLAQGLINDHSQLSSQLAYAVQSSGMTVPVGTLAPQHSALLAQLQTARPDEFDGAYRSVVITSHLQELGAHQRYSAAADQPALRDFAQTATSIAQVRLNQAQSLVIAPPPYFRAPSHRRAGERG